MDSDQRQQSHKMELLGRLAGGIAHDFNNMLAAITAYSDLLLRRVPDTDPEFVSKTANEIRQVALRAASLTRQILNFSRKNESGFEILDLNAIVSDLLPMLRHFIQANIELVANIARQPARVRACAGQIEQIVLNLSLNARDAMPDGGALFIETSDEKVNLSGDRIHCVVLLVRDTGCGMDEETCRRMFEPYFTTKERGKGTGFGLTTVCDIVRQCEGEICVESRPGKGTMFKIYLPLAVQEALSPATRNDLAAARGGFETILLVEDEEPLRTPIERLLRMNGYTVLSASGGPEAVEICHRFSQTIHLMITDMIMPRMNGRELAERVVAARPEMKVLYMSGLLDSTLLRHKMLNPRARFIHKPFSSDALAAHVREILDHA